MNPKEHLLKQKSFNKISKNGLLENDKKLIMQNLGFNNLSSLNIFKRKISINNNKKKNKLKKSLSNLKLDTKQIMKLMNFNNKVNQHMISSTFKKRNNLSLASSNKYINTFSEFKKSSESCKKKSIRQNILYKNIKLCPEILSVKPVININAYSNSTLYKGKRTIINSNNMTTAQNTFKTNKNSNSNFDVFSRFSHIPPIQKNKTKQKIDINISTPNLLRKTKKPIIKDKDKSYKIFNDKEFFNKKIYNNKNRYNQKIKTTNNSKSKNKTKNKIKPLLKLSKECLKIDNNINFNIKQNQLYKQTISKNKQKLSSIPQSDIINKEIEIEIKDEDNKLNDSINKNSNKTKKESRIDLHRIFSEKILQNLKYKNDIYNIISINMNNNYNNKNNNKIHINKQNTINIDDEDNDNNILNNNNTNEFNHKQQNNNNILLDNYNRDINVYKNKKELINKEILKNPMNFSGIDENLCINYNISEEEQNKDSFKSNKNLNKLYNCINLKILNKDEQEFQSSQDKNNEQTQTTNDRNYISKFIKQPIYNLSPRCFSTEKPSITKYSLKNKNYMFINDIELNNKNLPIINIKKILLLKDKSLFHLLTYTYDNYNSIISLSNLLKNKFNKCLKNIFQQVIDDFQNKYKNFLKVLYFTFEQRYNICKHKKNYFFNLIIKTQIITKETNKSYEIGCNYISYGKQYDNIWKFDLQNKKDIKLWLCTELDKNKIFTYTSQISSFSYLDEMILELNIFSKDNNIEPNSIEWIEPNISEEQLNIFENTNFISSIQFNELRSCEVEIQVLFWKNIITKDIVNIVEEFKNIFEEFFEIKEINYDISKYYFFKFKMIANKVGILKQNKFVTFDINIIEYEFNIQNEIQCIYLLNSFKNNKKMEIRLNTNVIFYIIDIKR